MHIILSILLTSHAIDVQLKRVPEAQVMLIEVTCENDFYARSERSPSADQHYSFKGDPAGWCEIAVTAFRGGKVIASESVQRISSPLR